MTTFKSIFRRGLLAGAAVGAALCAQAAFAQSAPLSDEAVRARADALIAQMTPEEKAGQLSQYFDLPLPGAAEQVDKEVAAGHAGSVLFLTDPEKINREQHIAVEQTRLKIPLIFGFDVIHGLRTIMPVPIAMAASWDPKLVEQGQSVAASEARAVGIDWAFAPMLDIARDPRWGRIVEGAGEDPYLDSAMAVAQVHGFQGPYIGAPGHIIAGPKHYAGYGAALGGRDYDEVNISDNELWNTYLPPFKAAVDAGAGNIMSAYMGLNGVPASGNHWLLTDVLRDAWGFKGFVVTDAGAAYSLQTHGLASDPTDAAVKALNAGVDMEMAMPGKPAVFLNLPDALKAGRITEARLDDAVRYVLEAKIRMGLFERPFVDAAASQAVLNDPAHRVVARIAAERTAVLLRNEAGVLPLDKRAVKSIAVIGPFANSQRDIEGPWVFDQNDKETVTVLAGLRAKVGADVRVDYSAGVNAPTRFFASPMDDVQPPSSGPVGDDTKTIRDAVAMAKADDVTVMVLGEAQNMDGEAASRSDLTLPGKQQELLDAVLATGKPVVVLLMSARPLDLQGAKPQALMDIWYPGSQGGAAVANLLFGDVSPGGKLPYNWVRDVGQVPLPYAHLTSHEPENADKRYWNEPNSPLYPFGFGLTYSTFKFSNLHIGADRVAPGQPVPVSVDLTNTGQRAADDVAQLYIHQRYGSSARPVRLLKGFQRVTLQPGETRTVQFTLTPDDLSYWTATSHRFVEDETTFDVFVGDDSTASLASTFQVAKP